MAADLGDARGGVCVGAGSLDRADCTLASRRCIWAVSDRICDSELEAGILCFDKLGFVVDRGAGVRRFEAPPETRLPCRAAADLTRGLGVMLWSRDGSRDLRGTAPPGLVAVVALAMGADASDMGGEGGSCTSESVSVVERALVSGGVVMSGELAVELGDVSIFLSKVGDPMTERSVEIVDRCRDSCFLILSCMSSASILSSASSSRSRCDSIRSCSRSCSPDLISSSIMTPRSIAWLYLDSISSRDDVVLRA